MAIDSEITRNVEQVRNATYGKDVREAIARGLELCYGYTSGETADEAAQRANSAAERVEGLIDDSEQAVHDVQQALEDVDDIIKVSPEQPTEPTNKIWIQPQDNTEYKVATFAAYEELWSRMNEFDELYGQGHGGIKSVVLDSEYVDPEDELLRRYVITYADDTTSEFFVKDGPTGAQGPVDTIEDTRIHYKKVPAQSFTPTPPTTYQDNLPELGPGDYLWTITEIIYLSGAKTFLYGLTRMGLNGIDGSGAVNSVAIGLDGEAMVGDIKLPIDIVPTQYSSNLLTSGVIYDALADTVTKNSPALTGIPTAPTPSSGDNSTQIATTAFVQEAISAESISAERVTLTMNAVQLIYTDESITENTSVIGFTDIDYSKFSGPITWTTDNEGHLTLTTTAPPSASVTFTVILLDTVST